MAGAMVNQSGPGQPRLVILDPAYGSESGHYDPYDDAVANGFSAMGFRSLIVGNLNARSSEVSGGATRVLPFYPYDIWGEIRVTGALGGISEFGRLTSRVLQDWRVTERDIVFVPNVTPQLVSGCHELARMLPDICLVLMLRYHTELFREHSVAWRLSSIRRVSKGRVFLVTDSTRLARQFSVALGLQVDATLPIPLWNGGIRQVQVSHQMNDTSDRIAFGFLGSARREKGFGVLSQSILSERLRQDPSLHFNIQAFGRDADTENDFRLLRKAQLPSLSLYPNSLDGNQYRDLLDACDVIVAAYDPHIYAGRTSNVALEALASGKPIIVTSGTWAEDLVEAFGGGVVLDEWSSRSLTNAMTTVKEDLQRLVGQANLAHQQVQLVHSAHAFVRAVLSLVKSAKAPPRVAIIYPWSSEELAASGAGQRALATARLLSDAGCKVRLVTAEGTRMFSDGSISVVGLGANLSRYAVERSLGKTLSLSYQYHLGIHLSVKEPSHLRSAIRAEISSAQVVIAESTHLVGALPDSFDKPLVVVCSDLLDDANAATSDRESLLSAQTLSLARADLALAVSETERDLIRERGIACELSITPPQRLDISPPILNALTESIHQILGARSEERLVCIFVGSDYGPNKDASRLLQEVFKESRIRNGPLAPLLVIVGTVEPVGTGPGWLSLGRVPGGYLSALYRRADLACLPIMSGTGLPIKTVEALANGVPCLGTDFAFRGLPAEARRTLRGLKSQEPVVVEAWLKEQLQRVFEDPTVLDELATRSLRASKDVAAAPHLEPLVRFLGLEPTSNGDVVHCMCRDDLIALMSLLGSARASWASLLMNASQESSLMKLSKDPTICVHCRVACAVVVLALRQERISLSSIEDMLVGLRERCTLQDPASVARQATHSPLIPDALIQMAMLPETPPVARRLLLRIAAPAVSRAAQRDALGAPTGEVVVAQEVSAGAFIQLILGRRIFLAIASPLSDSSTPGPSCRPIRRLLTRALKCLGGTRLRPSGFWVWVYTVVHNTKASVELRGAEASLSVTALREVDLEGHDLGRT